MMRRRISSALEVRWPADDGRRRETPAAHGLRDTLTAVEDDRLCWHA